MSRRSRLSRTAWIAVCAPLEDTGHSVLAATSMHDAVDIARRTPDIILADIATAGLGRPRPRGIRHDLAGPVVALRSAAGWREHDQRE